MGIRGKVFAASAGTAAPVMQTSAAPMNSQWRGVTRIDPRGGLAVRRPADVLHGDGGHVPDRGRCRSGDGLRRSRYRRRPRLWRGTGVTPHPPHDRVDEPLAVALREEPEADAAEDDRVIVGRAVIDLSLIHISEPTR